MIVGFIIAPICMFLLVWSLYAIAGINAEKFLGKEPERLDSVLSILLFVISLTGFIVSVFLIAEGFK